MWIAVDNLKMPPGLQGYVQFTQAKSNLVIPESSVTHLSGGEGMVMVAQAGKAVVKKVKIGRTIDNQREVLEGLHPKEQVVVFPIGLNPGDNLHTHLTEVANDGSHHEQLSSAKPKLPASAQPDFIEQKATFSL